MWRRPDPSRQPERQASTLRCWRQPQESGREENARPTPKAELFQKQHLINQQNDTDERKERGKALTMMQTDELDRQIMLEGRAQMPSKIGGKAVKLFTITETILLLPVTTERASSLRQ